MRPLVASLLVSVLVSLLAPLGAHAASSEPATTPALTARLVTPLDAVAPDATTLTAALHLTMEPGWKTYWRDPGTVGLPPAIDWSASENVEDARIAWPAPTRFRAFGIENYGYAGEVAHPIELRLAEPGAATRLAATVDLLVCADVCVPERVALTLDLPASGGTAPALDVDAAALVARWAERVPQGERFGQRFSEAGAPMGEAAAHLDADALTVRVALDTPGATLDPPDATLDASDATLDLAAAPGGPGALDAAVFPALGAASFDAPELRLAPDGSALWARLPVVDWPPGTVADGSVTVVLGGRAATVPLAFAGAAPEPPEGALALAPSGIEGGYADGYGGPGAVDGAASLAPMLLLAFLGGLILNAMPCVLPVLSIKLAGAVAARDRPVSQVRAGFLASAAGVMAFALALAGALVALRAAGAGVGWGVQFQSPLFLAALAGVVTLFAASMLDLVHLRLPGGLETRLARAGGAGSSTASLTGDFLAGAFAALLATPCSAPFLGTAVAFALTGSDAALVAVLASLGLGLAGPYLLVAARPSLVRLLPRPGAWMGTLRAVLGVMLLLTALWLLSVLASAAGVTVAACVALALAVTLLALWRLPARAGAIAAAGLSLALAAPLLAPPEPARVAAADPVWRPFERAAIAPAVARGRVVFVDVTADWCLTCKANKAATLDREPVASLLASDAVTAMRADWTRPDDAIRRYLAANGRFGIPFNVVYGPGAPDGIALPELLTTGAVEDALERAAGA